MTPENWMLLGVVLNLAGAVTYGVSRRRLRRNTPEGVELQEIETLTEMAAVLLAIVGGVTTMAATVAAFMSA